MPGNSKHPRPGTPSKESPKHKKSKSDKVEGHNMAAPTDVNITGARRVLPMETQSEEITTPWFVSFEHRLEQRFDGLSRSLDDIGVRLVEHDEKLKSLDFESQNMKADIEKLQHEKELLAAKLDDIENRNRRNNLVFFGMPEMDKEDCTVSTKDMLTNFVGVDPSVLDHIDRCHRTPTFRSPTLSQEDKPRIIHMAFSSFTSRETVRKACVAKFKLEDYKGKKIFVSEDFSKRVLDMRKKKMVAFKKLQREGKKPFFSYPDIIRYRENNKVVTV